jgi:hypothetical protein
MPKLRFWFYNPNATGDRFSDGWVNHVVAMLDPPFCHCELQFEDGIACSIYMGSTVVLKARTFDAPYYTCVLVNCTSVAYKKTKELATQAHDNQVKFSALSMSTSYLRIPYTHSENTTFCSKLIAEICQKADVIPPDVCCNYITPSKLHSILTCMMECDAEPRDLSCTRTTAIDFVKSDHLIVMK